MTGYRFCYVFEVYPDRLDEYQRAHDDIPPEVTAAMVRAGVRDYSLFRRDGLVIAVGTCDDPVATVFARLDADRDNAGWSTRIRALMPDPLDESGSLRFAPEVWRMPRPGIGGADPPSAPGNGAGAPT